MNPGDVPRFRPSLHTPTAALNDLSRLVAPLAGLQVRPPMSLRQTPAGYVLEYDGERVGETYIVRIPNPADLDEEGLVRGVFIQKFSGLPVANADGEEVLLYLVGS